eukprot:COSAG06_NODE_5470_length_3460_cov_5.243677_2_plen_382_part_00
MVWVTSTIGFGVQLSNDEPTAEGKTLILINTVSLALSQFAPALTAPAIKTMVNSDGGSLAKLGFTTTHMTKSRKRTLDRASVVIGIFVVYAVGFGLYNWFVLAIAWTQEDGAFALAYHISTGAVYLGGVPVVAGGFLLAMLIGAELANQQIEGLAQLIVNTSPSGETSPSLAKDPKWTQIEGQVKQLACQTLPCLSSGYGKAVGVFMLAAEANAFASFIWWLHSKWPYQAAIAALSALLPMVVIWPLAAVSTRCTNLMMALNSSRLAHLGDMNAHTRIFAIETSLCRVNAGQGIGFVISGTVVNTRMLKQVIVAVASVLPPLFAAVKALRPEPAAAAREGLQHEACGLTKPQGALVQSMFAEFNATCTYNISAGPGGVSLW